MTDANLTDATAELRRRAELPERQSGDALRALALRELDNAYEPYGHGIEIEPHTARVVLGVLDQHGQWNSYPSHFTTALVHTIIAADSGNRLRLARGFPQYVAAVNVWNYEEGGSGRLRHLAAGS